MVHFGTKKIVSKISKFISIRDAPIIGRSLCRYWPIVIYYVVCIMMALANEIIFFFNLNGQDKFSFYSYICKLGKHGDSIV